VVAGFGDYGRFYPTGRSELISIKTGAEIVSYACVNYWAYLGHFVMYPFKHLVLCGGNVGYIFFGGVVGWPKTGESCAFVD